MKRRGGVQFCQQCAPVGPFPSPNKKILAPVKYQLEPGITELLDTELESQLFLEAIPQLRRGRAAIFCSKYTDGQV